MFCVTLNEKIGGLLVPCDKTRPPGAFHFFAPLACWGGVVGMSQEMVHSEEERSCPKNQEERSQDAARRLASALESTRRGNLCLGRAVESGPSASDASRD